MTTFRWTRGFMRKLTEIRPVWFHFFYVHLTNYQVLLAVQVDYCLLWTALYISKEQGIVYSSPKSLGIEEDFNVELNNIWTIRLRDFLTGNCSRVAPTHRLSWINFLHRFSGKTDTRSADSSGVNQEDLNLN